MKDLFLSPAWLWAAVAGGLAAALAAALSARRARRRRETLVAPALAERTGLLSRDRWTPLAALLAVLATLGTGLALARPRWGLVTETVERRGADVVVVLDTSASMRAADVTPTRFVLARKAALSLVEKLLGRIAQTTGARFFRATDPAGLAATYAEIDRLEKTEVKTTTYTRWRETFPRVAEPAAGLLAAAALLALLAFPVAPR